LWGYLKYRTYLKRCRTVWEYFKVRKKQLKKEENSYKVNVSDTDTFKLGYRGVGNEQHNTINTIKNRASVRTYQRAEFPQRKM